jgi:hypothetical protein
METYFHPKVVLGYNKYGRGIFASESIKKGELLWSGDDYESTFVLTKSQVEQLEEPLREAWRHLSYQIGEDSISGERSLVSFDGE